MTAACSSTAANVDVVPSSGTTGLPTSAATATVPVATTAPAVPVETVAPNGALTAALDALAAGYQFESNASLGDSSPLSISGRVMGPASDVAVTNNGVTAQYVQLPPQAWARDQKGDWVELTSEVPVSNPLDGLRQPTTVVGAPDVPTGRHLQATYPASALGGVGDTPIAVDIVIGADGSVTATYPASLGAQQAIITVVLRPLTDTSPITTPAVVSPGSG